MCCCTYRYEGLSDADETAFAAGIALQAYYEGRVITPDDMQKCIRYWKVNISEMEDPVGRKRDVCCEPFCIPCCTCLPCYQCTHHHRNNPFDDEEDPECTAVYNKYVQLREKQIHNYKTFIGPVRNSTLCRAAGCKRVFGRSSHTLLGQMNMYSPTSSIILFCTLLQLLLSCDGFAFQLPQIRMPWDSNAPTSSSLSSNNRKAPLMPNDKIVIFGGTGGKVSDNW